MPEHPYRLLPPSGVRTRPSPPPITDRHHDRHRPIPDAFAADLVALEQELARMTVDVRAAAMTPEEIAAERESGRITLRGLLAGVCSASPPGHC